MPPTVDTLSSDVNFQETAPQTLSIPSAATSSCGIVLIAERGPFTETLCQSFADVEKYYGNFTANSLGILAAKNFFDQGGTELHVMRTVHFTDPTDPTTKTSAAATLTAQTTDAAASAGTETGANSSPWALATGETLVVKMDGGDTQTFTFSGAAASLTSGNGTYSMSNGQTLIFTIDGGSSQTVTFATDEFADITAATAAEVVDVLNAYFASEAIGAVASVSGSAVKITSNRKGTGSSVHVTSGTANSELEFSTTAATGTGNVSNLAAVTSSEVTTVMSGLTGGTTSIVNGALKITSGTTGTDSSTQVTSGSTAAAEFGFDTAVHSGSAGGAVDTLIVAGATDGTYANGITFTIAAATNGEDDHFNLTVIQNGVTAEIWANLSMDSSAADYCVTIVNDPNNGSNLIALTDEEAAVASPGNLPAAGTYGPLTGGSDGLSSLGDNDFIGGTGSNGDVGFRALDTVDDLALLICPDRATAAVQNAMITYCEITRGGSVFAIFDPPANQSAEEIVTYVTNTAGLQGLSERCTMYWPRILIDNPNTTVFGNAQTLVVPPSGAIAGIFSRVDAGTPYGVFVPPAGTDVGYILNCRGLEMPEVKKKPKRDLVYPELINPINVTRGGVYYLDGPLCLKDDGNWPTIGERRGIMFIESSLYEGLQPLRHKNINPKLLGIGRRATDAFMIPIVKAGVLATTDPASAYASDWGPGLNQPSVAKARKVVTRLSIATSEPAEFVIVNISPDTRALDAELAQAQATT